MCAARTHALTFKRLLTPGQVSLLRSVAGSALQRHLIFTGGTALACVYVGHRYSEDLDLFSRRRLDAGLLLPWQRRISRQGFRVERQVIGARHRYLVRPPRSRTPVRMDFVEFPFDSIEPPAWVPELGLHVDSLLDLAVNKVHALTGRLEAKDFVDLYVLCQHEPTWQWNTLLKWVRLKFDLHVDPLAFAHHLAQVGTFTVWPRLARRLPRSTIRRFFLDAAKRLGQAAW